MLFKNNAYTCKGKEIKVHILSLSCLLCQILQVPPEKPGRRKHALQYLAQQGHCRWKQQFSVEFNAMQIPLSTKRIISILIQFNENSIQRRLCTNVRYMTESSCLEREKKRKKPVKTGNLSIYLFLHWLKTFFR